MFPLLLSAMVIEPPVRYYPTCMVSRTHTYPVEKSEEELKADVRKREAARKKQEEHLAKLDLAIATINAELASQPVADATTLELLRTFEKWRKETVNELRDLNKK
jgi:hypothetical protein